jgi:hypothetical protein
MDGGTKSLGGGTTEERDIGKAKQEQRTEEMDVSSFVGRLLCGLGFHSFRVIDATLGFGAGGSVEKVECRRCGVIVSREA